MLIAYFGFVFNSRLIIREALSKTAPLISMSKLHSSSFHPTQFVTKNRVTKISKLLTF